MSKDKKQSEFRKTRSYSDGDGNTVTEELEVPKDFGHHILLYAKNWYQKTDKGILADLHTLLSEYIGMEANESDVKEILTNTFADYCPAHLRGRAVQEMLGWAWCFGKKTPEGVMVSVLGQCEGKYVDTDELLPVLVKERLNNG